MLVVTLLVPAAPGHSHGTLLFWGTTLPLVLALLALVGTAPWRRICPLAHASQLPRALGWHRGFPRLVPPLSWLGRHHLRLQWGLLVGGWPCDWRGSTMTLGPLAFSLPPPCWPPW